MGGRVWSVNEERVFWRIIVPQSQKRVAAGPAHTKTWEELVPLMQSLMGVNAKRTYTHLGLFEHFFQNIEKARVSPNAGVFVREYQQAVNKILKATEEERAGGSEFPAQSDGTAAMVNQDNDMEDRTDLSHRPSEVTNGEDQPADDFHDDDDATKSDKEDQPLDRLPDERVRYRAPGSLFYSSVPQVNMGPDREYAHGIPTQASPPAERLVLGDLRQPHDRGLAANMDLYNEVSGMQIRSPSEYSPDESASSRAPKRRNNHRTHPYEDVRPRQHGRNSKKGHDHVHSQVPRGNSTYCAAPASHHFSRGCNAPTGFGHHAPPMEYYDYGYHGENIHPYSEHHNHPQSAPSHPMVSYDQSTSHFHDSYGYGSRRPTLQGFSDSWGWQFPDRNSSAMAANYESSERSDSSWTSYHGHNYGLMEDDYASSGSRSSAVRGYESFTPENIHCPTSSASGSNQWVSQVRVRGSHSDSYIMSPQLPTEELEGQLVATHNKEFDPLKTPDRRQA